MQDLYSNSKPQLILKFTLILLLLTFLKEFVDNFALFNLRFYLSIHEIKRCSGVLFTTEASKATDCYDVTRDPRNNITPVTILALMLATSILKS